MSRPHQERGEDRPQCGQCRRPERGPHPGPTRLLGGPGPLLPARRWPAPGRDSRLHGPPRGPQGDRPGRHTPASTVAVQVHRLPPRRRPGRPPGRSDLPVPARGRPGTARWPRRRRCADRPGMGGVEEGDGPQPSAPRPAPPDRRPRPPQVPYPVPRRPRLTVGRIAQARRPPRRAARRSDLPDRLRPRPAAVVR